MAAIKQHLMQASRSTYVELEGEVRATHIREVTIASSSKIAMTHIYHLTGAASLQ